MELRRILVPVDFSEASEAALGSAIDLAKSFEAEVTVVHVLQPPLRAIPDAALVSPKELGDVTSILLQRLEELVARSSGRGVRLHATLTEGVPYIEITRLAKEHDLVVMSTQGRTGLAHLLLGSVAERVVRTSPVPVLTIRAEPTR